MRNIADVSPVKEIGVVADLEMGAALVKDLGEAPDHLPVTWTDDDVSMCRAPPREKDSPKNARGAKGHSQEATGSIGGEDGLLGLRLGFVVGIERLIRKWDALVDVDEIPAIEDHTGRTGVNKFRDFIFLGGSNDSLGAVYVYLPVEGWVLKTSSWRSCVDDARCAALKNIRILREERSSRRKRILF
jgi:hypothetical protein